MRLQMIDNKNDLVNLVQELGFLPLFKDRISGFSVEECTPEELWFSDSQDGPWEWKGPVIKDSGCAYGKFFRGKAGFISKDWYLEFANYRRDGYDFDARYEDGLASYQDKNLYDVISGSDTILSRDLKQQAGFSRGGKKGFDSIIGRLQMQGYVTAANFEYRIDRYGSPYGWGVARYATPESYFGAAFTDKVYEHTPEQSKVKMLDYMRRILPEVSDKEILRIIG